jgi:hypothetical protein
MIKKRLVNKKELKEIELDSLFSFGICFRGKKLAWGPGTGPTPELPNFPYISL